MEVRQDIPIPLGHGDRAKSLRRLSVGDSVFIQPDEAAKWRVAMRKAEEPGDCHFISRTVEGGIRIWRKS